MNSTAHITYNHHRFRGLWDEIPICGSELPPAKVVYDSLAGGDRLICVECWLEWLKELIDLNDGIAPSEEDLDEFIWEEEGRIALWHAAQPIRDPW